VTPGTGLRLRRAHFVGIGGTGLSPLAQVLLGRGVTVTGSDQQDGPRIIRLRELGARIHIGHQGAADDDLADADVVIVSSAVKPDNPELVRAAALGIPVRKRGDWLPELTAGHELVAVAGSHGKTTTTGMLALVLADAGRSPTAVIGGEVPQLGGSALVGDGPLFVLEADEYDGAFAGLSPALAVITNVEWEHPDLYPDEASVIAAFTGFAARVGPSGRLVACLDSPGVRAMLSALDGHAERRGRAAATVTTYGTAPGTDAEWRAVGARPNTRGGTDVTVERAGRVATELSLPVPGPHNVANALATVAAAAALGVPPADTAATLARFTGAGRRFEPVGEAGGIDVVDDYAHHPTELRVTLAAARQRAGARPVWAVFQPHTYSRLAALLDGFGAAFGDADEVVVTDIYAARETDTLGLCPDDLVKRIDGARARHVRDADVVATLAAELPSDAFVITLGAGDVTDIGPRLLAELRGRS
jgi:UDP-N-acetylmuramate--alanine ligase